MADRTSPAAGSSSRPLTPAEAEVCRLVATGRSNREIAEELYVSTKAVEFHVHNAFLKLGVHNRTQLAVAYLASEAGGSASSAEPAV